MNRTTGETVRSGSNSPQAAPAKKRRPAEIEHRDPAAVSVQVVLQAVADPIRLSLLRQLAAREPDQIPCGAFDLPVGKSGLSHHFAVLRLAGLIEQRDHGQQRLNRLRREEVEAAFPGLLALVLRDEPAGEVRD